MSDREPISGSVRALVLRRDRWVCHYCDRPGERIEGPDGRQWHLDHVVAVAKGGRSVAENLVTSCATCNMAKGVRDYHEFLTERGSWRVRSGVNLRDLIEIESEYEGLAAGLAAIKVENPSTDAPVKGMTYDVHVVDLDYPEWSAEHALVTMHLYRENHDAVMRLVAAPRRLLRVAAALRHYLEAEESARGAELMTPSTERAS